MKKVFFILMIMASLGVLFSFCYDFVKFEKFSASVDVYPQKPSDVFKVTVFMPKSAEAFICVSGEEGQIIKVLHKGYTKAGTFVLSWDGTNDFGEKCERGLYSIDMITPLNYTSIKKFVILK